MRVWVTRLRRFWARRLDRLRTWMWMEDDGRAMVLYAALTVVVMAMLLWLVGQKTMEFLHG